jgi:hypothetical protein
MEEELLHLCGYSDDERSMSLVRSVKKNYSDFDGIVKALKELEPFLEHSDYYLSLKSDRDMIKIKNDMLDEDEFMMMDSDILVWANQHNIDLEEGIQQICILGFKQD